MIILCIPFLQPACFSCFFDLSFREYSVSMVRSSGGMIHDGATLTTCVHRNRKEQMNVAYIAQCFVQYLGTPNAHMFRMYIAYSCVF